MATRITGAAFVRSALITITLGAMLSACGGSSSSNRNQGPELPTLLLNDSTRTLAVQSATHGLWEAISRIEASALAASDRVADACSGASNLSQTSTGQIITFTNCHASAHYSDDNWTREHLTTATGSVSLQEIPYEYRRAIVFSGFSFEDSGEEHQQWEDNGAPHTYDYSWIDNASLDGNFTHHTNNDARQYTAERFSIRMLQQSIESYDDAEPDISRFELDYRLNELVLESASWVTNHNNTHTGSGDIVRTLEDGVFTLTFDIVTALVGTSGSYPCFTSGELDITDSANNILNVQFNAPDVTFTLNNVGNTISCDEFAEEMGIDLLPPV